MDIILLKGSFSKSRYWWSLINYSTRSLRRPSGFSALSMSFLSLYKWPTKLYPIQDQTICRWHHRLSKCQVRVRWNNLRALVKCERDWAMEFNPDKCEVLRITRKKSPFIFTYMLQNVTDRSHWGQVSCPRTITLPRPLFELLPFVICSLTFLSGSYLLNHKC